MTFPKEQQQEVFRKQMKLAQRVGKPVAIHSISPKPKFALQVYASRGSSWIIDSGCTNHMTGEKKMFTSYVKNKDSQDSIIFGDGNPLNVSFANGDKLDNTQYDVAVFVGDECRGVAEVLPLPNGCLLYTS